MTQKTQNIIYLTILFLLLLLPALYTTATAIDLEYSWIKRIAYIIVVIVLLLVPALFLKSKLCSWTSTKHIPRQSTYSKVDVLLFRNSNHRWNFLSLEI